MSINKAGMRKSSLKCLCVMSNVKVFAKQDGLLSGWTNTTHYIVKKKIKQAGFAFR